MKEITPFLYSTIFKRRIDSFDEYNRVFSKWSFGDSRPVIQASGQLEEPIQVPKQEPIQIPKQEPIQIPKQELLRESSKFTPKKPDSFFWSIFIGQYGKDEFFRIESKYMNREMEEKFKMVEFFKDVPKNSLKSMKITAADIKEIMGDLITNKTTSMNTIPAFVLFYKRPIWIVREKSHSYIKIDYPDQEEATPILIYKEDRGYSCMIDPTEAQLQDIQHKYILLDKYNKVMKAASNYKSKELEEMASKINYGNSGTINTSLKKQELFLSIARFLQQDWGL